MFAKIFSTSENQGGAGGTAAPSTEGGSEDWAKLLCGEDKPSKTSIMDLQSKLFKPVADPISASSHKITVVGTGAVGMACAYSLLNQVPGGRGNINCDDERKVVRDPNCHRRADISQSLLLA